jgi:5-methylcytosine-specific restriction endonuclease McrA
MRKCVVCQQEKQLEEFRKRSLWRSHTCKKCYSQQNATGKENTGRFKKGQECPWKGKKAPEKRKEPRYIKKGRPLISEHQAGNKRHLWALEVKKRDNFKCKFCKKEKNLHAHHIIPWKENEELRFDLDNGITLCCPCHARMERITEMLKRKIDLQNNISCR